MALMPCPPQVVAQCLGLHLSTPTKLTFNTYATKANEREVDSRQAIKALVEEMDEEFGGKEDVKRAARKVLNMFTASKTISKQESVCLMAKLPLYKTSKIMHSILTKKNYKLPSSDEEGGYSKKEDFVMTYKHRRKEYDKMCLHQYFDHVKNALQRGKKKRMYVPHYVYGGCQLRYSLTEVDARHLYMIHVA